MLRDKNYEMRTAGVAHVLRSVAPCDGGTEIRQGYIGAVDFNQLGLQEPATPLALLAGEFNHLERELAEGEGAGAGRPIIAGAIFH